MNKWVLTVGGVVIVFLGLWQAGLFGFGTGSAEYQAVFLTNNQVYFGKVSRASSQYVRLTDIYYLQVTQQLQPSEQAAPPLQLIKLGGELHGPADEMRINRDQILFIEDLRSDSQIVTAIKGRETTDGGGNQ